MKQIHVKLLCPDAYDATSFYRGWGAWSEVRRWSDHPIVLSKCDSVRWNDIIDADILFVQRAFLPDHLKAIMIAQNFGVTTWIDYDDLVTHVGRDNPLFQVYRRCGDIFQECCKNADIITTSTKYIADKIKNAKQKPFVAKNQLPAYIRWNRRRTPSKKPGEQTVFVWRGTNVHDGDWLECWTQVAQFSANAKNIRWRLFGAPPYWIIDALGKYCPVDVNDGVAIDNYFNTFINPDGQIGDVLFVPLRNIPFNKAKSNCAQLEAVYGGMLTVSRDWEEWRNGFTDELLYKQRQDITKSLTLAQYMVEENYSEVQKLIGKMAKYYNRGSIETFDNVLEKWIK